MAGPGFLCIGAQKAGTTWLWRNLAEHPGVWLPRHVKEFHYFNDRDDLLTQGWRRRVRGRQRADKRWRRRVKTLAGAHRGDRSLAGLRWEVDMMLRRPSDDWYLSLFDRKDGRLTGDMTPDYLALRPETIEQVAALLPDVKIVLMLRNPIERLWSAAAFFKGFWKGREPTSLEREEVTRFFRAPHNRRLGDYLGGLRRWREHYPPDRFFLGFAEDIAFRPEELLRRAEEFLGLDPFPEHEAAERRINWMPSRTMPGWAAADLAGLHGEDLLRLSRRYGGHADWWRHTGTALADADPAAVLTYPLFSGPLWEEWLTQADPGVDPQEWTPPLQSGPLPEVRRSGNPPAAPSV